jgi:hypothetical protein
MSHYRVLDIEISKCGQCETGEIRPIEPARKAFKKGFWILFFVERGVRTRYCDVLFLRESRI